MEKSTAHTEINKHFIPTNVEIKRTTEIETKNNLDDERNSESGKNFHFNSFQFYRFCLIQAQLQCYFQNNFSVDCPSCCVTFYSYSLCANQFIRNSENHSDFCVVSLRLLHTQFKPIKYLKHIQRTDCMFFIYMYTTTSGLIWFV